MPASDKSIGKSCGGRKNLMKHKNLTSEDRKYPFLFFFVFIFILSFLGTFLTPAFLKQHGMSQSGQQCSAGLLKEKKNSIDVLVIGDSESYTSVSPMELWKNYGITSYVAGKSGQKISDTKDTLETALLNQKPKYVLLETNNLFRYKASDEEERAAWLGSFLDRTFPFLKYHNIWKNLFGYFGYSSKGNFKGFRLNAAVRPYTGKVVGKVVTGDCVTRETLKYLDEIQEICREKGATLILYSAPSPKCYKQKKTILLSQIARERGLTYLNLNAKEKEMQMDWYTDTRDHGDHLNTLGALKTTDYIGNYLKTNWKVPDRSESSCAGSWNRAYRKYAAARNHAMEHIELIVSARQGYLGKNIGT
jgi:hypothetical protein